MNLRATGKSSRFAQVTDEFPISTISAICPFAWGYPVTYRILAEIGESMVWSYFFTIRITSFPYESLLFSTTRQIINLVYRETSQKILKLWRQESCPKLSFSPYTENTLMEEPWFRCFFQWITCNSVKISSASFKIIKQAVYHFRLVIF